MTNAELIAGYAGPLMMAVGAAMIVNRPVLTTAINELAQGKGLIVLAGILTLLAGLAIVRAHNVWVADWTVIVTILGWLCVAGGIVRIVWPDIIAGMSVRILANETHFKFWALFTLALGAFLAAKGYALI